MELDSTVRNSFMIKGAIAAALVVFAVVTGWDAPVARAQSAGNSNDTDLPNPAVRQFGPRLNKPEGPAVPNAPSAAQALQNASEVVGKHGDWTMTCDKNEVKMPDGSMKKPCAMLQTTKHPERKNVNLTLVMLKGPPQAEGQPPTTMMRVIAPIGVYLPVGVALEIDGAAVGRVPFTRCLPTVCIAFAEASPPTLDKMRKGAKANFIIYEAPGLGMSLELSLKGFTAALNNLGEL
jgi:invasion protein IalB